MTTTSPSHELVMPPGPRSYQDVLDDETNPIPDALRAESALAIGQDRLDVERFISREYHDREVAKMWTKVWQMVCRAEEIPNVGDVLVYDIAGKQVLVVRAAEDLIKAYPNACLHRGRALLDTGGNCDQLRCQFHGFTWSLDGRLVSTPTPWDMPKLAPGSLKLPSLPVDEWEGFVFVSLDRDAQPLRTYLGGIVDHFQSLGRPTFDERHLTGSLSLTFKCNWKVAQDAFMEALHLPTTHPQTMPFADDVNVQYDVFPGERHWNRFLTAAGVPSARLDGSIDEQAVLDMYLSALPDRFLEGTEFGGEGKLLVPAGSTARQVMASIMRTRLGDALRRDTSRLTDAEVVGDAIQYFVFPNLHIVHGVGGRRHVYRFRPVGNNPAMSTMEIFTVSILPEGVPRPPVPEQNRLGPDDDLILAKPQLGDMITVFQQDFDNLGRVQDGMHSLADPYIMLTRYQESRIRHMHEVLDSYLDAS
jgi:phenylpropionate dioxygenase-like ring-hydroxylating dioxygenase large terminal subunit